MKVMLAVDLRNEASAVVERALPWIRRLNGVVDLVFVDTYRAMLETYTPANFLPELVRLKRESEAQIDALLARLPPANRGRAILDTTTLDDLITQRAAAYALVVVGTHGRTGLSHLWAGSVAERMVRFSPTSVLVLREPAPPTPLRILFAVDLSEDSAALAAALAGLAERLGATVDLLTVDQPPMIAPVMDAPALYSLLASYVEESRIEKSGRLNRSAEANFPPILRGRCVVETGVPLEGILSHAAEADLVVVGTHGRAGLAHALIGSVAERVVRRATRPVLVLRA